MDEPISKGGGDAKPRPIVAIPYSRACLSQ